MAFMIGAPSGSTFGPSVMDPAAMPAGQPPPQAAPQAPAEPYKPNFLDILQGVVFNGQSPAEAAMAARGRDFALQQQRYGIQRQQMLMDTLKAAPPDQRLAMLLNPNELGKAVASRFESMALKGGETRDNGEGGGARTVPLMGFDEKSGRGYTSLPGLTVPNGPSLGGDYSAKDGVIASGRTGDVINAYSLPQIVAPGSVPNTFTPRVGDPSGSPALTGPISAKPGSAGVLNSQGALDPAAFFKSFVLPHEGGWNARDMNGSPTKYGINAKSNPGVDVANLKPEDASAIFASKYFPQSGAAQLPPAMAAVHADTSFINPAKAHEFLAASGGDPSKYMDLRDKWMGDLVAKYPAAQKYAQAWSNRNADLRAVASQLGATPDAAAPGWSGPAAKRPSILDPNDPANAADYKNVPVGTVLQRAADGTKSVLHEAEYSPSVRSEIRGKFLSSDPYNQHIAAASALSALQHNIGQMTGPAAYTILDTMARTINPGAVARQGTITAIEGMMGVPAHVVGTLQNYVGEGKIPLQSQQAILNAVTPFAQSHYDEAKRLFDANAAIARAHKFAPEELTAPIGERPSAMFVSVPAAGQRQAAAVYATPKGPMKWTGTGWRPQN